MITAYPYFPRIKFIESGTSINSSLLKDGPGMPSQSRDSGGSRVGVGVKRSVGEVKPDDY